MELKIALASQFTTNALVQCVNQAFQGYIGGTIQFTESSFYHFLHREEINLALSDVAVDDDLPIAFSLIARRGWTSRLAAMGVVAGHQEKGAGKCLLRHSIIHAQNRGDRFYTLECFEENHRGIRLYTGAGFYTLRRLLGFRFFDHRTHSNQVDQDLVEIDIPAAANAIICHSIENLPWQVEGQSLIKYGAPNRAYQLGESYAIISNPGQASIALRALIVPPSIQRQGHGRRMLQALMSAFPGKGWVVPQICPEEYGAFFIRMGFEQLDLAQVQMLKDLTDKLIEA